MKKKILTIGCIVLVLAISSCAASQSSTQKETPEVSPQTESAKTLDLRGEWEQVNSNDSTTTQIATITDNEIEIYWLDSADETKSLYWAGTYVQPTDDSKKFEWESENNKEKTGSSILASGDETKHFTYENGQISYDVSALGTTKTVRLEKKK